ncbi:hypothetical protein SD77_0940 [Bacillus badius]|uniref:Uncharacterized protein n=1 Tax=Bacillus badius TaxID=1455 RepID=A0ABR5AT79_BACBA|nr:hypothetical protein SD78_2546 [Bacillus badius]KIL77961.1 hypothetical protein SD77_0940 [Bacillus badius]
MALLSPRQLSSFAFSLQLPLQAVCFMLAAAGWRFSFL